jgi:hypothetical protein
MTITVQVKDVYIKRKFEWKFIKYNKYLTLDYVFNKYDERILFISGLKYEYMKNEWNDFKVYIHNIKEYEKCIQILRLIYKKYIFTYNRNEVINFFEGNI